MRTSCILKSIHTLVFVIGLLSHISSQNPGWVAPSAFAYTYNASVVSSIHFNDIRSNNPGDQIACFVGNEIRGLGVAVPVGGGQIVHFISIFSNQGIENMQIKIYSAVDNKVYDALSKITFRAQNITGTIAIPFIVKVYKDDDAPISISNIPFKSIYQNRESHPIVLSHYLISQDNDPVIWTATPSPHMSFRISADTLWVTANNTFSGLSILKIRATEQTILGKYAEKNIFFFILPAIQDPLFRTIPGEGITKGSIFSTFNLNDFEERYNGPCLEFDYEPIFQFSGQPEAIPDWEEPGLYQNSMTIVAKIDYSPKYVFSHPDDKAIALIDGEIRSLASRQFKNGQYYYYFTIGGGPMIEDITIQFYSGYLQRVLEYRDILQYKPYTILGSLETPLELDFAPIKPVISNSGLVHMLIQDKTWLGEQIFRFIARDCEYGEDIYDTKDAVFCIVPVGYVLPVYYYDGDGDGFGNPYTSAQTCNNPGTGYVSNNLDCNDNDPLSVQLPITFEVIENSGVPDDGNVCKGSFVTITSMSSGTEYVWNNLSTSFQIFVYPIASQTYTITVTDNIGCTGSSSIGVTVEGTIVKQSGNEGPASLRSVLGCIAEGGTITYDQPSTVYTLLTSPLSFTKNVTIMGLNSILRPSINVDFNNSLSGLSFSANKVLTIKNTDILLINPQSKPAFTGPGSINVSEYSIISKN